MLSNKAKREMLRLRSSASFPYLIEINHPVYGVFRYVNMTGKKGIEFEGNVYTPAQFHVEPPSQNQDGYSDATLTMASVDQEWIIKIRETNQRATVRFVAVIHMVDGEQHFVEPAEDLLFELTSVSWNRTTISWKMGFVDPLDMNVPVDVANIENVPGCQ